MAVSVTSSTADSSTVNTSAFNVNTPGGGVRAGRAYLLAVGSREALNPASVPTVLSEFGTTWTMLQTQTFGVSSNCRVSLFAFKATDGSAGNISTVTWVNQQDAYVYTLQHTSGVDITDGLTSIFTNLASTRSSASASTFSVTGVSLSTKRPVFNVMSAGTTRDLTSGAGYTLLYSTKVNGSGVAEQLGMLTQWISSGTTVADASLTANSSEWAGIVLTIQPTPIFLQSAQQVAMVVTAALAKTQPLVSAETMAMTLSGILEVGKLIESAQTIGVALTASLVLSFMIEALMTTSMSMVADLSVLYAAQAAMQIGLLLQPGLDIVGGILQATGSSKFEGKFKAFFDPHTKDPKMRRHAQFKNARCPELISDVSVTTTPRRVDLSGAINTKFLVLQPSSTNRASYRITDAPLESGIQVSSNQPCLISVTPGSTGLRIYTTVTGTTIPLSLMIL